MFENNVNGKNVYKIRRMVSLWMVGNWYVSSRQRIVFGRGVIAEISEIKYWSRRNGFADTGIEALILLLVK